MGAGGQGTSEQPPQQGAGTKPSTRLKPKPNPSGSFGVTQAHAKKSAEAAAKPFRAEVPVLAALGRPPWLPQLLRTKWIRGRLMRANGMDTTPYPPKIAATITRYSSESISRRDLDAIRAARRVFLALNAGDFHVLGSGIEKRATVELERRGLARAALGIGKGWGSFPTLAH